MSAVVQIEHETLEQVAASFQTQSEANAQMLQQVRSGVDKLHGGDWIGRGSDAFFAEMNDELIPAVQFIHATPYLLEHLGIGL